MAYQNPQDEGYSEDPLTVQLSSHQAAPSGVPLWMADLSLEDRTRKSSSIKSIISHQMERVAEYSCEQVSQ